MRKNRVRRGRKRGRGGQGEGKQGKRWMFTILCDIESSSNDEARLVDLPE